MRPVGNPCDRDGRVHMGSRATLQAIATIVIIGARHVKHAGPTPANKTGRRASGSGEFSSGGARPR